MTQRNFDRIADTRDAKLLTSAGRGSRHHVVFLMYASFARDQHYLERHCAVQTNCPLSTNDGHRGAWFEMEEAANRGGPANPKVITPSMR